MRRPSRGSCAGFVLVCSGNQLRSLSSIHHCSSDSGIMWTCSSGPLIPQITQRLRPRKVSRSFVLVSNAVVVNRSQILKFSHLSPCGTPLERESGKGDSSGLAGANEAMARWVNPTEEALR
ncbi:hypothetical protein BD311DRAFT_764877 [Dichomitus squalens]|uniref:Uncharacterized protein n=1 Tax=Dichomitus squalens TaxID=114155 RepID=A0A4Q9MDF0_9APHY|nr:hypothetical protein BD311DRAFT_764877 [Dichomitus squalens]